MTIDPATPRNPAPLFDRIGGRPTLLTLLKHFYADVRQHHEIGPVFNARIQDWPAHIEKIADFWTNATGGTPRYSGPMPARHMSLGLEDRHFQAWLDLWRRQCRIQLPKAEAEELIGVAESIGDRLQQMIAWNAGRPAPGGL
jgi:hemoglobin